jgi:hypothetical protein
VRLLAATGLALGALGACSSDQASPAAPADAGAPTSALAQTCPRGARSAIRPATCNGAEALCARRYDQVAVPMTHNAMASTEDGFSPANQTHGLARQLADGVRGMMLDVHLYDPESNQTDTGRVDALSPADQLYLCHGTCALGKRRLLDALCDVTRFLDENPAEILTFIVETYVADADLDAVLKASGLAERAVTHAPGAPWPTLREMVDTDKRLVVMLEKGGGTPAYLSPAYDGNLWDTPYSFKTQADFTCALGRGKPGSPLFLVNHWLGRPLADLALAREVNVTSVLGKRVTDCTAEAGRAPTFIGVDFYEVGDLLSVVRTANGL